MYTQQLFDRILLKLALCHITNYLDPLPTQPLYLLVYKILMHYMQSTPQKDPCTHKTYPHPLVSISLQVLLHQSIPHQRIMRFVECLSCRILSICTHKTYLHHLVSISLQILLHQSIPQQRIMRFVECLSCRILSIHVCTHKTYPHHLVSISLQVCCINLFYTCVDCLATFILT